MKIFPIITHSGRRIEKIVAGLVISLSVLSCDVWSFLPLENGRFSYDIAFPDSSAVAVRCMYFSNHHLLFDLKGEYVIIPDSLKLEYSDKNITPVKQAPFTNKKGGSYLKNSTRVKDDLLNVRLNYELKDKSKAVSEPLAVYILPSDFIMKDGERVLTDTIKYVLAKPKVDHFPFLKISNWKKVFARKRKHL